MKSFIWIRDLLCGVRLGESCLENKVTCSSAGVYTENFQPKGQNQKYIRVSICLLAEDQSAK